MRRLLNLGHPIRSLSVLMSLLVVTACGEGNPDAEDVKTTLSDCTVEAVGRSNRESCVMDSTDPRVTGSWRFKYEMDTGGDDVTFRGEVIIENRDGLWTGPMERVVTESESWKGGRTLTGLGDYTGLVLSLEGEGDNTGATYALEGQIGPANGE